MREAQASAEVRAARANDSLENRVERAMNAPESLAAYFEASGEVHPNAFRRFARQLKKRFPEVLALEWAPRVASGDRPAFEARFLAGRRVKPIRGVDSVKAAQFQFPIALVEPAESNSQVVGADLYSSGQRRQAIDEALSSGRITSTSPINLIQEPGRAGVLVFAPIKLSSSQEPKFARGVVLGVYDAQGLFTGRVGAEKSGAHLVSAMDVSGKRPMPIWASARAMSSGELVQKQLRFGSRLWRLDYTVPISNSQLRWSFLLGALGATCSLLIALRVRVYVLANSHLAKRADEFRDVALDMMDELTASETKRPRP